MGERARAPFGIAIGVNADDETLGITDAGNNRVQFLLQASNNRLNASKKSSIAARRRRSR